MPSVDEVLRGETRCGVARPAASVVDDDDGTVERVHRHPFASVDVPASPSASTRTAAERLKAARAAVLLAKAAAERAADALDEANIAAADALVAFHDAIDREFLS
jgi:hypothetical protein